MRMSALLGMCGSSSRSLAPVPSAMVRRPVRLTCTGMAWPGSVISMAVEVNGPTCTSWPMTPAESSSG